MAEDLADFGKILVGLKYFALCCQAPDPSSCLLDGNNGVARINLMLAVFKTLCLIGKCVLVSAKSAVFRIWYAWSCQSNTPSVIFVLF